MLSIGSLFSGIGGLELGLEWAGLGPVQWQVEKDPFCSKVLAHHWPNVERFEDVKEVGAKNLRVVDLICGGFPCQDISSAGKGAGLSGSRSGLWFEYARIIGELRPRWVIIENVASGANRWVDQVCDHLGRLSYEALPIPISAANVGAPHLRKRVFIVAHTYQTRLEERQSNECTRAQMEQPAAERMGRGRHTSYADTQSESTEPIDAEVAGMQIAPRHGGWSRGPLVSPVCGVDDGIPDRVDQLKALGNAVVPQCAEVVGWVVRELLEGVA